MPPAPVVAVLDANVLYPFTLRDTLLRAAARDFYQLRWTRQILDEMQRNLVSNAVVTGAQAVHLRTQMEIHFPESMVAGYESLIDAMPNEAKDRHVAAAAVHAGAQVIVTNNLKDFARLPGRLRARSADVFLLDLFHSNPDDFIEMLNEQAGDLRRPPMLLDDILIRLQRVTPRLVQAARRRLE